MVDVAQALFQAGLQQDIFARARSAVTDSSASASSSSSVMNSSCAGLTVSGIIAAANETMPSPIRGPDVSWGMPSLHNSGNWLNTSGTFGNFASSGVGFPFTPLPDNLPGLDHSAHIPFPSHHSMPPATVPAAEPMGTWRQTSKASASAPAQSVPRTSVVKPQEMSNFYHCKTESRGEQAMAFWQLHTGELLQYNDAFAALLEKSQAQLQEGFMWYNIQAVDQDLRIVSLQDEGTNALKAIQEFYNLVLAGTSRYSQISFSFIAGRRLKHIYVTIVAFAEEVLWICSEIVADNSSATFAKPARRLPAQQQQHQQQQQQQQQQQPQPQPQHQQQQHTPLSSSQDAVMSLTSSGGPNERKLVKVATRKKKPWDQNLVKFSLKKMRKRSKRKADQQA